MHETTNTSCILVMNPFNAELNDYLMPIRIETFNSDY